MQKWQEVQYEHLVQVPLTLKHEFLPSEFFPPNKNSSPSFSFYLYGIRALSSLHKLAQTALAFLNSKIFKQRQVPTFRLELAMTHWQQHINSPLFKVKRKKKVMETSLCVFTNAISVSKNQESGRYSYKQHHPSDLSSIIHSNKI